MGKKIITTEKYTIAQIVPSSLDLLLNEKSDIGALLPIIYHIGKNENWKYILELGTGYGRSTSALAEIVPDDGLLITIDKNNYIKYKPQIKNIKYIIATLGRDDQKIKDFIKNLNIQSIDCLFIDADHRADAIKKDFENYKYLVKDWGYIMFHDICLIDDECEGPDFWFEEQFKGYEKLTISISNGLGILRKIPNENT